MPEPDRLELTVKSITNLLCNNNQSGSISVLAKGGTLDYIYLLKKTENSSVLFSSGIFENLSASEYWIMTIDAKGCSDSLMANVTQPDTLKINISNRKDKLVNCPGNKDTIWVNPVGGTIPYAFIAKNAVVINHYAKGFGLFGLPDGLFCFTIEDANGCSKEDAAVIS